MKTTKNIIYLFIATATLILSGCATSDDYRDEREYSDMPWNTPQTWEGSRSIPGLSGGQ
jgi:hypothetical protein